MTKLLVSDMARRMGRKKQWAEDMQARFPEGTFERIAALLEGKEDRTDFVRAAVEREIKRRERAARLSGHSKPEDDGEEGL
ncbi:YlcI/YnfO family protein [Ensifer aridi]|uniref:YlcI/YnfO family protein n=1 Tax=Ensifer aridi TaxID=1708715 RepID=UPI001FCDEA47|nr:YlcI/YnfO family protein [Ensifer aridi]